MLRPPTFLPLVLALLAACAAPAREITPLPSPASAEAGTVGVLLMAHGGSESWNGAVDEVAATVGAHFPTALAFGMADPRTLAAGLDSLREAGVERVAVVRMFLSGKSFREQTDWFLGLAPVPPEQFILMDHGGGAHASHPPSRDPIPHGMEVATHDAGIMRAPEAVRVMRERAREMARAPGEESVLLVAHGMGDEAENLEVLQAMERAAAAITRDGFAAVEEATLREDWPEARVAAEARIRAFVGEEGSRGRRVLVIPFRLHGFGPYAGVLEGLSYEPGTGLLPHPLLGEWALRTAREVVCGAGWASPTGSCPTPVAER